MKTESPTEARKGTNCTRCLPVLARAALCLSLASCVYPYDDGRYGDPSTITTYQPGYRTTGLPLGYRRETISGHKYYYHDGSYYRLISGSYVVTDAPPQSRYLAEYNRSRQAVQPARRTATTAYQPGHRLNRLPNGYRSENLGGSTYYYHNGSYYQRNSGGYVVAEAPRQSRYYSDYSRNH